MNPHQPPLHHQPEEELLQQAIVKLPCGKSVVLLIAPTETVGDVQKRAVLCFEGAAGLLPPARFRSRSRNYYMRDGSHVLREDSACLRVGCLQPTGHINLSLHGRERGGCFVLSFSILCILAMAAVSSVCTCGLSLFLFPLLVPWLFVLPLFFL